MLAGFCQNLAKIYESQKNSNHMLLWDVLLAAPGPINTPFTKTTTIHEAMEAFDNDNEAYCHKSWQ